MAYPPLELAMAFIKTGELQDALDALHAHLAATPDDDAAQRLLVDVLMRVPDWRAALSALDGIAQPIAADWVKRSIIQERQGDFSAAQASMRQALLLEPSERSIERLLHLLQAAGDFDAAQRLLERVPETWQWQERRADLAIQAAQPQAAIGFYSDALRLLESTQAANWQQPFLARIRLARAHVYRAQNAYAEAEADYLAAAQLMPDEPMIPFYLGMMAALRGDLPRAQTLCTTAYSQAGAWLRDLMAQQLTATPQFATLAKHILGADLS